jgi:hypothetical protein
MSPAKRPTSPPSHRPPRISAHPPHTTFGKSGHRAPHISFKFFACLRGQSAVTSSLQSNNLAWMPYRTINRSTRYCPERPHFSHSMRNTASLPTISRKVIAPSRGITTTLRSEARAPSELWRFRYRPACRCSLQKQLSRLVPPRRPLRRRPQYPDEPGRIPYGDKLNARTAGGPFDRVHARACKKPCLGRVRARKLSMHACRKQASH